MYCALNLPPLGILIMIKLLSHLRCEGKLEYFLVGQWVFCLGDRFTHEFVIQPNLVSANIYAIHMDTDYHLNQELDSLFLSTIHPDLWILLSIVVEVEVEVPCGFNLIYPYL